MPRLQARDSGIWWGTLGKLQLMLRKASQALFANEQFTIDEMHNYRMAVTEGEVINGCLSVDNVKDHVIIYTRILQNINLQNLKRASAFIDIQDRFVFPSKFPTGEQIKSKVHKTFFPPVFTCHS